jgi:hypothetical protein
MADCRRAQNPKLVAPELQKLNAGAGVHIESGAA